jgi:hypothetical protein
MLFAAIIFAVLMVVCGIVFFTTDSEAAGMGGVAMFVLMLIATLCSINWSIGSHELTGYIYSSSNKAGYTTAHIRFSQNAGTDAQPEFCVKTDSDAGRAIQKYVGGDQKVKVYIPSYFYFANNPFACGTTGMNITEVK